MSISIVLVAIVFAGLLSLFFSTLTYSLREFSRARLDEADRKSTRLNSSH